MTTSPTGPNGSTGPTGHAERAGPAAPGGPLRLVSWNVHDLLGDQLAVTRVLRSARPDVVCLQEAPRWPGSRWRLAALARGCGLLYLDGGRTGAGTAVLVAQRVVPAGARAFRLPVRGLRTRPRGAVVAELVLPGASAGATPLTVASVHLGLDPAERAAHVALIAEKLAGAGDRLVVAGDLNERPDGPSWAALAGYGLADPRPGAPPTFPARAPRSRIDAVLARPGVEVLDDEVWRPDPRDVVLASDHRPVLALLRVR